MYIQLITLNKYYKEDFMILLLNWPLQYKPFTKKVSRVIFHLVNTSNAIIQICVVLIKHPENVKS